MEEKRISDLVVCGMMTHMCVDTTVRAAKNLGYSISLIEDACVTKDLAHNGIIIKAATIGDVYMSSLSKTFAEIINADEWIKEHT